MFSKQRKPQTKLRTLLRFIQTNEPGEDDYLVGARQKAVENARNLKSAGVDINIIAKCVGLSVEEVEKL